MTLKPPSNPVPRKSGMGSRPSGGVPAPGVFVQSTLVERLQATQCADRMPNDGSTWSYRNPDGPEAADTIAALEAEIARLTGINATLNTENGMLLSTRCDLGYGEYTGDILDALKAADAEVARKDAALREIDDKIQIRHPVKRIIAKALAPAQKGGGDVSPRYPHMCCDGHAEIGHSGDDEMCPACKATGEAERLRAELHPTTRDGANRLWGRAMSIRQRLEMGSASQTFTLRAPAQTGGGDASAD